MAKPTLIRRATVIDGGGGQRYRADVEFADGRIARIAPEGLPHDHPAAREIDADGLVLAPGFVDMHAHSDLALVSDADHSAKLSQGVTTEVLGQDGIGYSPVTPEALAQIRRQIAGWNGDLDDAAFDWLSVGDYLGRLDRGVACNAAVLVPQGNLRMLVVGQENRTATAAEIDAMSAILREGLDQGAVGMSSGLSYTPGMFASTAELEALCAVVADVGGYYAPHTRSYGGAALDSYAEVLGIGRRTGCPIHLTHATMNFAANRGRADELLALIDDAISDGVDVTIDSYPYLPGATTLAALLPSWLAAGGPDALLGRLAAGEQAERMRYELEVTGADGFHGEVADWETIQISGVVNPALEPLVGATVAEIARENGRDPIDQVVEILLADELATSILMHVGDEGNVRRIMRHDRHCGGSDGILIGSRPHPRAWGTFARYLAHYARDEGVLSLEQAVRHLSATPSARLGLSDRGRIAEGMVADALLFDPVAVSDEASFEDPRRRAAGIPFVFVAGVPVIDGGLRTGALPGRALRSHGR